MSYEHNIFGGRTLVVGFEGWSDSGEAASGAVRFMALQGNSEVNYAVDPDDYYDYQYSRPTVGLDEDGQRQLSWPGAELLTPESDSPATLADNELFYLLGAEPSRNWKAFVSEVSEWVQELEIQSVIFLGSIPADTPHTRPIHLSSTSQNEFVRRNFGAERSSYQGPVGIQTVLAMEFERLGIPTIALWASVPHYVQNGPSPKAMLALVTGVEKLTGTEFDHTDLSAEAFAWERGIDELAENDEEMSNYIQQLEASRDASDQASMSGDELAMEFEKFLANQNDGDENPEEPKSKG